MDGFILREFRHCGTAAFSIPAIHWSCNREDAIITPEDYRAHGLKGTLEPPDWPPLTLAEVDALLRRYPLAGGAEQVLSVSPRPFSAASVVATPRGRVFVKRHHGLVRDREGLLEEHRLIAHLAGVPWAVGKALVGPVLADADGETAVSHGEWTYEVHRLADGLDVYEQALSWTPFLSSGHAGAAGWALARLHLASAGFREPARGSRPLVSSFMIFAGAGEPVERMEEYLDRRPLLRAYAEQRDWRATFDGLFLPLYAKLSPWLGYLAPLWTHNDFHASNLMWSGDGDDAEVTGIIDFGLADRTNAVHDIATAIERNCVEWLRMDEPEIVHVEQVDALLAGYEEVRPLSYEEARALVAMLPLVHCEFALSETDYFLASLRDEAKARLGYEGYFIAHAKWLLREHGRALLGHLERWAEGHARRGMTQFVALGSEAGL